MGTFLVGGTPLDDDRLYSIAACDWIASGGDGYEMLTRIFSESTGQGHGTCRYFRGIRWRAGRLQPSREELRLPARATYRATKPQFDYAGINARLLSLFPQMTQTQISRVLGVTSGTVYQWGNNLRRVSWRLLRAAVDTFGVRWDWLIDGLEPKLRAAPPADKGRSIRLVDSTAETFEAHLLGGMPGRAFPEEEKRDPNDAR